MTRDRIAAFGYAYVALALAASLLGLGHPRAGSALLGGAAFAFVWFIAGLRSRLVRYDPDGFFATVVVLGGGAFVALQMVTLQLGTSRFAPPAAACATTVIFGATLAALRARKVPKWFGRAGLGGGVAVLVVCLAEGTLGWTLAGRTVFASMLGFMIWVLVTTTVLLRR